MLSLDLRDPDMTRALGRALARVHGGAGSLLVLEGPLGAGKTSLAKAYVAEATGTPEDDVTSPTFVLANEYPGKPGVIHIDAYRLSGSADLTTLGYGPLETTGRAVLVEWASRVAEGLPRERLEVELAHAPSGRHAVVRAHGARAAAALAALEKEVRSLMKLKLALCGATGRMGKAIMAAVAEEGSGFELVQAIARTGQGVVVAPGVQVTSALAPGADVAIDFSSAEGLEQRATEAAALGIPLVGCATGLTAKQQAALDVASSRVPILYAANTSLGITLLERLVGEVAKALGESYDVEVVELHHKRKLDSPSGTALVLAQALAQASGRSLDSDVVHGRSGKGARRPGEIGMHALRLGDVVGEHRVYFAGAGERIELAHVATSRDTFARGALRAAAWLAGKPPGRYRMSEVLGLPR